MEILTQEREFLPEPIVLRLEADAGVPAVGRPRAAVRENWAREIAWMTANLSRRSQPFGRRRARFCLVATKETSAGLSRKPVWRQGN